MTIGPFRPGNSIWRAMIAAAIAMLALARPALAQDTPSGLDQGRHPLCARTPDGVPPAACAMVDLRSATPLVRRFKELGDLVYLIELQMAVAAADFALIGEVHDNALHHRTQAGFLTRRFDVRGRTGYAATAVVFEHIRWDQQDALDRFKAAATASGLFQPDDLFTALDWSGSGWPDARLFYPVFQSVLTARAPIIPGDPARGRVRDVARGGLAALGADERARLKMEELLSERLADALSSELAGSHCGMLPASAVPGMALAQRYRDAHLADAMIAGAEKYGSAVLLAGNGHVRTDRAVPWHLRQRAPGKSVVAVMLVEVEDGKADPLDYVPRDPEGRPAADFIILTPRAVREDPCEKMRASMPKKG